ncbi:ribbon-helix-helix domain-containing protein [Microbacterium sp. 18062]|uniref:ribbon-helix-helix domain-containing protein n=1 Tax=Microbacterium sp. 18062 TaxID=2681410 RepID=UPI00135795B2|nr:ribbon-helix-helix domain-containing protein [Microbacterium sp. 18062]
MRTTLSIDDALLDRAKQRAQQRGVTLGRYVEEALREHLSAPPRVGEPVSLPVFPGGRLRPGIDPSSNRALYDALDEPGGNAA